jgi:hypothetical protein
VAFVCSCVAIIALASRAEVDMDQGTVGKSFLLAGLVCHWHDFTKGV